MDDKRFSEVVEMREQKLYRISRTLLTHAADREDAIQETLLRAWRSVQSVRDEHYFDTWLIRILINECRRVGRRNQRAAHATPSEEPPAPNEELRAALMSLDEKYRLAIVMHYLEGYPIDELARILRLPAGTVKWRLHQGRARLKNLLGGGLEP